MWVLDSSYLGWGIEVGWIVVFRFFFQARRYIPQFGWGAGLCEFCHSSHLGWGIELEFYGPFRADITSPSLVRFRASVVTFLRMLLSSPSSPTVLKLSRFCNVFLAADFLFFVCTYFSIFQTSVTLASGVRLAIWSTLVCLLVCHSFLTWFYLQTLLVRPISTLTVGVVGTAGRSRRRECLCYQPNLYTSLYTC